MENEIKAVKKLVRRDYDFDGLLDLPGWDLDVEIVEFAPHGDMNIAEL